MYHLSMSFWGQDVFSAFNYNQKAGGVNFTSSVLRHVLSRANVALLCIDKKETFIQLPS